MILGIKKNYNLGDEKSSKLELLLDTKQISGIKMIDRYELWYNIYEFSGIYFSRNTAV